MAKSSAVQLWSASFSHPGWQRSRNEDCLAIDESAGVFILADGMGGHAGGDVASQLACQLLLQGLTQPDAAQPESLQQLVSKAHHHIVQRGQQELALHGLGTTLLTLQLQGTQLQLSWLGDSRIYRIRQGQLSQLSRDHSLVQQLLDRGVLSADEVDAHPQRHLLQQALGQLSGKVPKADVLELPAQTGDVWLLCSDGVSDMLSDRQLQQLLTPPAQMSAAVLAHMANALLDAVLTTAATDNASAILVYVASAPRLSWRQRLAKALTRR